MVSFHKHFGLKREKMRSHILGMATIKSREESLKVTLLSLVNQCDKIYVYLNDYTEKPKWLSTHTFSKVVVYLGNDEAGDLGDAAKFYGVKSHTDDYFISVDDDIIYANNFVETMCLWSEKYNGDVLCTTHGRRLGDIQIPIQGFFQTPHPNTRLFYGFNDVLQPEFVHFGGTGSMCFDLSKKRPPLDIFDKERNIADIWIGIYAQETQTPILVVPHKKGWLRSTDMISIEDTIWGSTHRLDIPKHLINTHLSQLKLWTL